MSTENLGGKCGESVSWNLDPESGILSISGQGPMTDYREDGPYAPWYEDRDLIKEVVIGEGVTTVGEFACVDCANLVKVTFSSTVDTTRFHCLTRCTALKELRFPEGVRVLESRSIAECPNLEKIYLPLSLKAFDFRALIHCDAINEVTYAGNEEQWNKIRIGKAANGNKQVLEAKRIYEGKVPTEEKVEALDELWFKEKKEVVSVVEEAAKLLKKGGDGKLHVMAINAHENEGSTPRTGDCQFIIFPDGQLMMIDCGHRCGKKRVLSVLEQLGVKNLKYFVASHCHGDHVGNGLPVAKYIIAQGGKIENYYSTGLVTDKFEPELVEFLKENGTEMHMAFNTGEVMEIGGVKIEILGPTAELISQQDPATIPSAKINDLSMMMKFTWGETVYLTTGDLFKPAEHRMVEVYGSQLKADVMKANHHGIATSSSVEWLDTVSPEIVFAQNPEIGGTVLAENLIERKIPYFTTGLHGDILIGMGEKKDITVKTSYGYDLTLNQ